jgi:hypothetical protein
MIFFLENNKNIYNTLLYTFIKKIQNPKKSKKSKKEKGGFWKGKSMGLWNFFSCAENNFFHDFFFFQVLRIIFIFLKIPFCNYFFNIQ